MITQEYLKEVLNYNSETGIFTWKVRKGVRGKVGAVTGTLSKYRGYLDIKIDGVLYPAHRLAWLYVYGKMPDNLIDHIDCDRVNNRISNLREATHSENLRNTGRTVVNTSGFKGVSLHKMTGKWQARVGVNRTRKYLGLFDTPEEAFIAYQAAAQELHGEFYRDEFNNKENYEIQSIRD